MLKFIRMAKSRTWPVLFFYSVLLLAGCSRKLNPEATVASTEKDRIIRLAVIPDTQYYTAAKHGGNNDMFDQQIKWIIRNQEKENIVYVAHLGDISDHGEQYMKEWENARKVMYQLEKPTKNLPDGIPYGMAVGNHDTSPNGAPGLSANGYETSFGRAHFQGKSYYGGTYKEESSNANHYDLFSADGTDFIVLYIAYNESSNKNYDKNLEENVLAWAGTVLTQYKNRKAIVVSHSLLAKPASDSTSDIMPDKGSLAKPGRLTAQGKVLYNFFRDYPNVFMMLCGHRSGEAYWSKEYKGNTIKIFLSDYQSRRNPPYATEKDRNGGNGLMRLMTLNLDKQTISVSTFAPRAGGSLLKERDGDSEFTVPLYK